MGCTSSTEVRLQSRRRLPPFSRSISMPIGHVVSLTSSTLGSLKVDQNPDSSDEEIMKVTRDQNLDIPCDVAAAARKVERWVVKTPSRTPPNEQEPETINAWELMEDLEDNTPSPVNSITSPELPPANPESSEEPVQPDPEVISNFRKAMTELSPLHPTLLRSAVGYRLEEEELLNFAGIVKARVAEFQEKIDARRVSFKLSPAAPPGGKGKVVLYFTSLRGVRKTYEDCWNARVILQSYGARIDERDVSMHGGFKEELNAIVGHEYGGIKLPKVFANGRFLGGAEEVTKMHEAGELGNVLRDCEMVAAEKEGGEGVCEACGGVRFQPCECCSGSCKVFKEEEEEEGGGFRRCPECNENGLVRCPLCY
ncbi:Uncharacterized protein AXF42_Ash002070 [Apostasia shenzhenica]|uniref:Glutaredoxin domain-containing protein n=1 Tax=Apostasia shenzhenica TaxID=1088818 RepID=A0A2I0AMI2_9ASPA|nr:Uncharacterized protein AXF42_Ash002070 [Apostasia shenzhenica]